jgi:hypothetical protein
MQGGQVLLCMLHDCEGQTPLPLGEAGTAMFCTGMDWVAGELVASPWEDGAL